MSSVTIVVPPIADSISEGTLAEHTLAEGNAVAVDDVVAKLDTDKVSVDIRATAAGKISKWIAQVGDTVKVGAPLLSIEVGAAGSAAAGAPVKPLAPVLNPAEPPSKDETSTKTQPRAQSGAQAPQSIHPTDPADQHHQQGGRIPSILFRFVSCATLAQPAS
jgi:2-oxoglutarate dehydrogenase E2 component (dihydrolipoamide succinyltransferase)